MKKYYNILIFIFICNGIYAQDTINRRYSFGYNYCIFTNVINLDTTYIIKSLVANLLNYDDDANAFVKLNLDGSLNHLNVFEGDTFGISPWQNNMIKTLDGNFAQFMYSQTISGLETAIFIKQTPNGDTLKTTFLDTLNVLETPNGGIRIYTVGRMMQLQDSTYLCTANVENLDWQTTSLKDVFMLIKLDKQGNYLWHKIYWNFITPIFYISAVKEILQYNDSTFLLCGGINKDTDPTIVEDDIGYNKWLFVDSMGNEVNSIIFNQNDDVKAGAATVIRTVDKGFVFAGAERKFIDENNYWLFPQITKLDSNFNTEWHIKIDSNHRFPKIFNGFTNLIALNDTEFVVTGYGELDAPDTNTCGLLVKFNINGEVLWKRKYVKVPELYGAWPKHYLYDMDITPDSGFIMVGQAINYNPNIAEPYGQLGWVVKTDKYGCLVPNCQQYDNIDTTTITPPDTTANGGGTDTTITTITEPANVLFPNPTTTNLYYYNVYTNGEKVEQRTCYIYNMQGQLVQQFTVNTDKITYIINVSQLASGTYIFKVVNANNSIYLTKKFVKV